MLIHCNSDRKVWCCRNLNAVLFHLHKWRSLLAFPAFQEYDIKGLEEEFYLLITQVPSCLAGLYLSKNDASCLRLQSPLPQLSMERQGGPGNDRLSPRRCPGEVVWCVLGAEAGGRGAGAHPTPRSWRRMGGCPCRGGVQAGMSSAAGPGCEYSPGL